MTDKEEINLKINKHFENNNFQKVLLTKYGEIALRGKNRGIFEGRLITNIRKNLEDLDGDYFIQREQGRFILINVDGDLDYDKVIPRVEVVLGIVGIAKCIKTRNQDIENLKELSLMVFKDSYTKGTFKVETKRSDKNYPMLSNEVSQEVGGYIFDTVEGLEVDVRKPDVVLRVELRNDAYIYTNEIKTFGGLPAGTSGKAVSLLSGGFDSPVASFLMAKRGVALSLVYFDSPPYTSEQAKQKVLDIAQRLSDFTGKTKLYVIPFTETQLYLQQNVPPEKLTILLKHTMIKLATKIANEEKAHGIVMGDSIGQVASQTMESLLAVNNATDLPIFRPLATYDKQEIIDLSKKIGTHDISARPFEDCCTIFVADHPETKPKANIIQSIAKKHEEEIDKLIDEAIETCNIVMYK